MNALVWLIPVAVALGAVFVVLFLMAVKGGQFDDPDGAAERILHDDD